MSKVLVIGSTVIDVVLNVEALPTSGSDIHVLSQEMMLGGCAYNVHRGLSYHNIEHRLFSPIGHGMFAQQVKTELIKENINLTLQSEQENGCCYCLIEPSGERSFVCHRGAEYRFKKEWLDAIDISEYDSVYLCGLELEEHSGSLLVDFICNHPELTVYFAPGPRVSKIDAHLLERCLNRGVIVHVNEEELFQLTHLEDLHQGLEKIYQQTQQILVVSLGEKGSMVYDGEISCHASVKKVEVVNTNGAGDSHISGFIAGKIMGKTNQDALIFANDYASKVVAVKESYL